MGSGRYVLTGAPGAGKTVLATALRGRGHHVVPEAATDVVQADLRRGVRDSPTIIEDITAVQITRQGPRGFYDRSPYCTLALARYANLPVPDNLTAELTRTGYYEPTVFFLGLFPHITPTPVRRISYPDAVRFEAIHRDVYLEYGFTLIDIPPAPVEARVTAVEAHL
jgi:predicted ATPase